MQELAMQETEKRSVNMRPCSSCKWVMDCRYVPALAGCEENDFYGYEEGLYD